MADQIVLAWEVDVAGTSYGPAAAAAALGAVPLYVDPTTDPVLGQLFGLTVASDATTTGPTTAKRTLTLNMNAANLPTAPPPFPCNPRTSTPPVLPYPLRKAVTLTGSFFVSTGLAVVATTAPLMSELVPGDSIQFLSQEGVFYTVFAVTPTTVTLTTPYTGVTGNTSAFKEVSAPATLAAMYSTSMLDFDGVGQIGARTVDLTYRDSTGAGPFTVTVSLNRKRPVVVPLALGSVDIAEIINMVVTSTGPFNNNLGQITLCELSAVPPPIPPSAAPTDLLRFADEAQLLITRALAYLPPSYFAFAQPQASYSPLAGDFFVTTGSKDVPTSDDQTGTLAPGDIVQFASQFTLDLPPGTVFTVYAIATVAPKRITLTTPYTGINDNNTGEGNNSNTGTKGNLGPQVQLKPTAAFRAFPPLSAPPSNDALKGAIGQFVQTETAAPPPNPPLPPATVPTPTFLSGFFTQTLQLALAVPVKPQPIALI